MLNYEAAFIQLKNERLEVQISQPGMFYTGSRFDWAGFVTRVTLDCKHTFCVPESLVPGMGSGGQGFCGEFGIDEPVGYEDAAPGNYFPKIGVGLLKKPDSEPYNFYREYSVTPLDFSVIATAENVKFHTKAANNNGYSYEYVKEIGLDGNFLTIRYMLKNTSSEKIVTNEYCHNFIGIDNEIITEDYKLKLPNEINAEKVVGDLNIKDNTITWPGTGVKREFYCIAAEYVNAPEFSWELYNTNAGVGVREIDDFKAVKFALWGSSHVVSPETFIKLELDPGQPKVWSRKYEFYY
ncbi:MAG: hypothetical protein K0R50_2671 [Eubacterium sp.]|jgi:hypothetical protein|nr:hypothetical protein [Eubacterium sp.]